jgi:VanZ family protein
MGLIAIESTDTFSAANTSRFLYPIFHFLTGVSAERFVVWHFYIRKSGHFVGYFGLSFFLFRSWREALSPGTVVRWSLRWAWVAWLMTAFVACMDEYHQTFIPSRTGTIRDVLLDSTAALVAQIILFIALRKRNRDVPIARAHGAS